MSSLSGRVVLAELSFLLQAPASSLVGRGGGRRRKGVAASLAVLWPAMVAGGEGEKQYVVHRRLLGGAEDPCAVQGGWCRCSSSPHLRWWIFLDKCFQAGGNLATAILGHGGQSTTSDRRLLSVICWSSTPRGCQVVRPRKSQGSQRRRSLAGRGRSSALVLLLGGNALRTPAAGGRDAHGLDCFFNFLARVFLVKVQALSSNTWFFRTSDVKGLYEKYTCHVLR